MKYIKLISLLASILFLSSSSCNKKEPCGIHYLFEMPFTVTPIRDTFNIGDTIWIESTIPHLMEDKNTGKMFDVGFFNYLTELNIFKITTNSMEYTEGGGHSSFTIFPIIGNSNTFSLANGLKYEQLIYEDVEDQQELKIGVIAKNNGIFGFAFISYYHKDVFVGEPYFSREVEFEKGDCNELLFTTYKTNDGTFETNNFHLLEQSSIINDDKWKKDQYLNTGMVTFVVTE